jgi:hypothetical protein
MPIRVSEIWCEVAGQTYGNSWVLRFDGVSSSNNNLDETRPSKKLEYCSCMTTAFPESVV